MHTLYAIMMTAILSIATAVWAHFPEGVTYLAFQFPDDRIPMIDGDLRDWDSVSDVYRIVTEDMYTQLSRRRLYLPDFTILLMVGWSNKTNMLYTAAQTFDNVHMCLRPTGEPSLMWLQDDLEILIDIDHSGGQYRWFDNPEESKRQEGAQATQYALAYPNADGINIHSYTAAMWDVDPPYFYAAFDYEGEDLGEGTTSYETAYTPWVDLNWMGAGGEHHRGSGGGSDHRSSIFLRRLRRLGESEPVS